jgi:hypothetical protein
MMWHSPFPIRGWLVLFILLFTLPHTVSAASGTTYLNVVVKDGDSGAGLDRAQVYLDGGYRGETAGGSSEGVLLVQDIKDGAHTLRVTRDGYREKTVRFRYPDQSVLEVRLAQESLVFLGEGTPSPTGINVVFYPSSTSYSCSDKKKVSTPVYIANESKFREDVLSAIRLTYLELDKSTSADSPLPADYRDRFNFYYYYDPALPADAFAGCSGTIPDQYWDDVTFSDVTVILYPTYIGRYSDNACEPTGCTQDTGTAHTVMKVPADQPVLLKHETGHAVYGLVDTYCGDTYYYQNSPYPNVWASEAACMDDARSRGRDPANCRQIKKGSSGTSASCSRNYWQWDPSPDIMANGYSGKFGTASTQRINYVLSKAGA